MSPSNKSTDEIALMEHEYLWLDYLSKKDMRKFAIYVLNRYHCKLMYY